VTHPTIDATNRMVSLRNVKDGSNKFYEVEVVFDPVSAQWGVKTSWGRVGTAGQSMSRPAKDEQDAIWKAQAIANKKISKGYRPQEVLEQTITRAMTTARQVARDHHKDVRRKQNTLGNGLYDFSLVTRTMNRLSESRHSGLKDANRLVSEAIDGRFDGVEEGGRMTPELWGRLYEPQATGRDPVSQSESVRALIHEQLDGLPEWDKVQNRCQMDSMLASVTAVHLCREVLPDLIKHLPKPDPNQHGQEGSPSGSSHWSDETQAQTRAALKDGLDDAQEVMDRASEARDFIWGDGAGEGPGFGGSKDPGQILDLAKTLDQNHHIAEVMRLVGQFLRMFDALESELYGTDGYTPFSVTPDNDLRRLLPVERLGLAHPILATQTLYRLMLKQTLCFEVRSKEPSEQGPFVIAMDSSGSMMDLVPGLRDQKIVVAGAFALAAITIASREGRACSMFHFNTQSHPIPIDMSTPEGRAKTLRKIASLPASGGTDFHQPLRTCHAFHEGADILFICDGQGPSPPGTEITQLAKASAQRLHYIHIGQDKVQLSLKAAAAQFVNINEFGDEAATLALGAIKEEDK